MLPTQTHAWIEHHITRVLVTTNWIVEAANQHSIMKNDNNNVILPCTSHKQDLEALIQRKLPDENQSVFGVWRTNWDAHTAAHCPPRRPQRVYSPVLLPTSSTFFWHRIHCSHLSIWTWVRTGSGAALEFLISYACTSSISINLDRMSK